MPRTNPPEQTGRSRTTMVKAATVKAVDHKATPFKNFEDLTAKLLRVPKGEARKQGGKRD